jgi:hypothetical protein
MDGVRAALNFEGDDASELAEGEQVAAAAGSGEGTDRDKEGELLDGENIDDVPVVECEICGETPKAPVHMLGFVVRACNQCS